MPSADPKTPARALAFLKGLTHLSPDEALARARLALAGSRFSPEEAEAVRENLEAAALEGRILAGLSSEQRARREAFLKQEREELARARRQPAD